MVKLAAEAQPELEMGVIRSIAGKLEERELAALKELFARKGEESGRGLVQLSYGSPKEERGSGDGAFLV